jgi:hypothetical protein
MRSKRSRSCGVTSGEPLLNVGPAVAPMAADRADGRQASLFCPPGDGLWADAEEALHFSRREQRVIRWKRCARNER